MYGTVSLSHDLPAGTFDPVKDPQSPHNRNLLVVQPVRKQRVSWICRPSDLVLVMVLVTTLVTKNYLGAVHDAGVGSLKQWVGLKMFKFQCCIG